MRIRSSFRVEKKTQISQIIIIQHSTAPLWLESGIFGPSRSAQEAGSRSLWRVYSALLISVEESLTSKANYSTFMNSRQEGVRVGASDEMKVIFLHAAANAETFWSWLALSALRTKGLPRLDTMECETQWSWEKKSAKHTKDPDMLELCLACAAGSEGFAWICWVHRVHHGAPGMEGWRKN